MAAVTYTVKRGDNLWNICSSSEWGPKISGNNTQAKINTVVSLNNIANANLIYPGQVLTLSSSGGASASSSAQETPANSVVIDILSIKAESTSGKDAFAIWHWKRDHTKGYKIRWEYDAIIDGTVRTLYEPFEINNPGTMHSEFTVPDAVKPYNNWVQIFVTPISETYTVKDASGNETEKPYFEDVVEVGKQYHFKDNPPYTPEKPTCEVEGTTLTMEIDMVKKETDAGSIIFQVVKDNTSAIYTSPAIPVVAVTDDYGKVSHQYTVSLGSKYKVRAKAVATNGKQSGWTDFSEEAITKPTAPSGIIEYKTDTYKDGDNTLYKVYLKWDAVSSASEYRVQYTTVRDYFDNPTGSVNTTEATEETSLTIMNIEKGYSYFFRIVAINKDGVESDPSAITEIPVGSPPGKPATWSSSESAFEGDTMELNWTHNSVDGSAQTYAEVSLKIGDSDWVSYVYENTTDSESPDPEYNNGWTYGQGVSYKGNLYFKMDTTHPDFLNKKIQWKVRTAGVTSSFSNDAWSAELPIYIYEKPTFEMSMTKDQHGTSGMIMTLDSFPFYVNGKAVFEADDPNVQKPVGYYVRIVSNEFYITVDDIGNTKTINADDAVYDKYVDTSESLELEISANDVDLESGINYTLYCTLDLSTGLTLTGTHEFYVSWASNVSYNIVADVAFDKNTFTSRINPYAVDNGTGKFVDNVTLAVYRREYNGKYTQIASGIPNTNTAITDPHPALDYARYRIVAKDMATGAISFYDAPAEPVKCSSIIIQWDEEWNTFDVSDEHSVEGPAWSGSLLELKYNVEVSDNRSREVSMVKYAGRENPVAYYGTHITEAPSWNVTIPREDKEMIYALRRLSIWTGDVYIREPSGMGYWANVKVSFNQKYKEVTTGVTLSITKVEGGV